MEPIPRHLDPSASARRVNLSSLPTTPDALHELLQTIQYALTFSAVMGEEGNSAKTRDDRSR